MLNPSLGVTTWDRSLVTGAMVDMLIVKLLLM